MGQLLGTVSCRVDCVDWILESYRPRSKPGFAPDSLSGSVQLSRTFLKLSFLVCKTGEIITSNS